ncbi:hypothetical protein ACPCK9_30020 [Streptomyces koyangensis]|uniref:hypothetical protein n=1 Tax=Streptomyces koyangensis TaxID=188770 RepID=UPI0033995B22
MFLSTVPGGVLDSIAEHVESVRLDNARAVHAAAAEAMSVIPAQSRFLVRELFIALGDVLRIAEAHCEGGAK